MDRAVAAKWVHPYDREPVKRGRRGYQADMMRGLVSVVVLPMIYRERCGVRSGVAAFVIVVRHAAPHYFGRMTEVELARGLGMSLGAYRAEAQSLVALGGQARDAAEVLVVLLDCVLPPAGYGLMRRWRPAYRSLVCMLYLVSPESFNGMTKRELGRLLSMQWSRLMECFADVEGRLYSISAKKNLPCREKGHGSFQAPALGQVPQDSGSCSCANVQKVS